MISYSLAKLSFILYKLDILKVTGPSNWRNYYPPSAIMKLKQNLDKKNAHKELLYVEEKIKATKSRKTI